MKLLTYPGFSLSDSDVAYLVKDLCYPLNDSNHQWPKASSRRSSRSVLNLKMTVSDRNRLEQWKGAFFVAR